MFFILGIDIFVNMQEYLNATKNDSAKKGERMIVRKKYVVQKSFRIDQRLEYDMSLLAELTNRSQNDLVNAAIEGFLQDNAEWILQNAIVEQFAPVFEYTGEDYNSVFKMGGVEVTLNDNEGFYRTHCVIKRGIESIDDDYEKRIAISDEDAETKLKEYLRYVASYIDPESEDTREYLKKRVDYSDYIPTKKGSEKKIVKK